MSTSSGRTAVTSTATALLAVALLILSVPPVMAASLVAPVVVQIPVEGERTGGLVCDGNDQVHVNNDVTKPAVLDGGPGPDHVRAGTAIDLPSGQEEAGSS